MKLRSGSLERNKVDKPLGRLTKKRREKVQINQKAFIAY